MANERPITLKSFYDPDLCKLVQKSRKAFTDSVTGERIEPGSPYYQLPIRVGRRLINATVSVSTFEQLEDE